MTIRADDNMFADFAGKPDNRFAVRAFAVTARPDFPYHANIKENPGLDGLPYFHELIIFHAPSAYISGECPEKSQ